MANSSDWITALLERPDEDASGPAPLSWLPDFAKSQEGFVEKLPFERPTREPEPRPGSLQGDLPEADTGDALEDILRQALAERLVPEELPSGPAAAPFTEQPQEPIPDPVTDAFARGEAAGRQAAMEEGQALSEQKTRLRHTFRALDQAAMDALASDLAETVIALCAQTLAEFIPSPGALKARCLEAAQRLGSGAGEATLYLHPDDLALIDKEGIEGWRILADPAAERGGLRFETADGCVSDRPADWRRAIAAAIKG